VTAAGRTPLLNPGAWPPGNSFVLPDHKMVYISVTKVACSSLRWMVADLVGEDFQQFYRAPGNHQSRLMTIHAARHIWQHSPQIKQLAPEVREEISRDNGWFIFAAIRDPWSRLWSAWQSKLLVRHDSYVKNYGREPWFPHVPAAPGDIIDDWLTFVAARPWESHAELALDPHFMPQYDSVHPDRVNYTRVYDMNDMPTMLSDIHAHLASVGKDKALYLPRVNLSPIALTTDALTDDVAATIEDSYRRDFDEWGDRWTLAAVKVTTDPLTMDLVRSVDYHGVANQRIGDLSEELRGTLKEMGPLRKRLAQAEAAAAAPAIVPAVRIRARRAARRVGGRVVRRLRSEVRKRQNA
jgi:hypothetical protein